MALRYFSSMTRKEDWSSIHHIHQNIFRKKPNFDTIVSMEMFSEKLNPVNLQKFEFENRRYKETKRTFLLFWPIKIQA